LPLHLIKLCVGADTIKDLEDWIEKKMRERKRRRQTAEHIHTTRMMPKRGSELLEGGSLYWVIRGEITCRQVLVDIRPFVDKEGIGRCQLVLDRKVVPVEPRPFRAFQGWRYFNPADVPPDVRHAGKGAAALPEPLRRELRELGLL
jgi:hypothetical protein